MIVLENGQQLASTVCPTRVIVVRAPQAPVELTCGGAPMVAAGDATEFSGEAPSSEVRTLIGKRYEGTSSDIELLCTKPGTGPLACDGEELTLKAAKALPSTD